MPPLRVARFATIRALGLGALLIGLGVIGAGCSSSHKSSSGTTTTTTPATSASTTSAPTAPTTASTLPSPSTTPPPNVQILSLTGPRSPIDCNAPSQIQLHWRTRGAAKVELRIDDGPIFATYPDGPRDPLVPLTCDGSPHVYELIARAADGRTAIKQLRFTEHALVS